MIFRSNPLILFIFLILTLAPMYALASDAMVRIKNPNFTKGLAAYQSGNYEVAYRVWLPLAQDGDPAAIRNIGQLYRMGLGIGQDFKQARWWYKRAAEMGLAGAQANYADMLARGQGGEVDQKSAANWFIKAAARGHVLSQYRAGLHYLRGLGVEANPKAALFWFKLAEKSGLLLAKSFRIRATELLKNSKKKINPSR